MLSFRYKMYTLSHSHTHTLYIYTRYIRTLGRTHARTNTEARTRKHNLSSLKSIIYVSFFMWLYVNFKHHILSVAERPGRRILLLPLHHWPQGLLYFFYFTNHGSACRGFLISWITCTFILVYDLLIIHSLWFRRRQSSGPNIESEVKLRARRMLTPPPFFFLQIRQIAS